MRATPYVERAASSTPDLNMDRAAIAKGVIDVRTGIRQLTGLFQYQVAHVPFDTIDDDFDEDVVLDAVHDRLADMLEKLNSEPAQKIDFAAQKEAIAHGFSTVRSNAAVAHDDDLHDLNGNLIDARLANAELAHAIQSETRRVQAEMRLVLQTGRRVHAARRMRHQRLVRLGQEIREHNDRILRKVEECRASLGTNVASIERLMMDMEERSSPQSTRALERELIDTQVKLHDSQVERRKLEEMLVEAVMGVAITEGSEAEPVSSPGSGTLGRVVNGVVSAVSTVNRGGWWIVSTSTAIPKTFMIDIPRIVLRSSMDAIWRQKKVG
ncbi:DUF4201 domain-containing protein [Plasmodiophora brassicae]